MKHLALLITFLGSMLFFPMCGCAIQETIDSKIYRVDGPEGSNYFRVRIVASTFLSDTAYETGLYPAYAVDAFIGKAGNLSTVGTDAEKSMRGKVAKSQKEALDQYLAALKEDDPGEIKNAAKQLREIQMLPMPGRANFGDLDQPAQEMEFNPLRSLVDHSANKKHVIVLSADPNAILDQIAAFAEEAETTKALVSAFKASITSLTRDDLTNLKFDTPIRRSIATELDLLSKSEDVDSLEKLLAILNEAKSNVENLK